MSVSAQLLVEGLDPTGQAITASILLQAIREATMKDDKAILIVSESTPDVVANPEFIRFLWAKRTEKCKILRAYNDDLSSWEPVSVLSGTVTAAMIAAAAVTLSKLYAPGAGEVGKILQVAASGAFELVALTNADNSVTLAKLNKATGNGGKLIRVAGTGDGTGFEFFTLDAVSYIAAGALPLAKLALGTDLQYIRMVSGVPTWTTASPGFNPTYITAVNLLSAVTGAVNSFTTINLAANLLAAGASTNCRVAILKLYGQILEDTAITGIFNTREDNTKSTVEMLKVGTTAEASVNKVISGHSIVFQRLSSTQTFDYQIPTGNQFATGLTVDFIGYIEP